MSVTFFIDQTPAGYQATCECGNHKSCIFGDFSAADIELKMNLMSFDCGNEYCDVRYAYVKTLYSVNNDVNMSNVNAKRVIEILGFENAEDAMCGDLSGEDFMGRVLIALAVEPMDAGTGTVQNGNFIECGRPEGYLQARLMELQALGEYALNNSLQVHWG